MADVWAVVLAASVSLGAWWATPVPLVVAAVPVLAGLAGRRPLVLCAGAALLASGLADRAWSGVGPTEPGGFAGVVALAGDPEWVHGAVRVVARTPHGRLELWARGSPARRLAPRLAGERVAVAGRVTPPPARMRHRLGARHIRGRLQVEAVGGWAAGDGPSRAANRVRQVLADGARVLPPPERALYAGVVLGDDRDQTDADRAAFRAAGLSHLTAVSGQNVAFLLTLAGPALVRLPPRARWAATLALVAWFVLLTRFEPSVLRAGAMAGLAATAFVLGRPASTVRLLALAVAGLLLVDPLLVWSVGWWLSVSATAGIAVLSAPLAERLPGPRWLVAPVAVTAAAQVGVAPVSLAVFGAMPLVAVPANLLAVPVAGPVMVWGVPAGLASAWLPDGLARLVQLPTHGCLAWLRLVAHGAARLPLGSTGWAGVLLATASVAVATCLRRLVAGPSGRARAEGARRQGRVGGSQEGGGRWPGHV